MLNCFLQAIEFILANPKAKVGDFDAISNDDAQWLRHENGDGRPAVNRCIHSMLREVTDRQPDAAAIHAWDGQMTFNELDAAASTLANHLMKTLDVCPEVMVGICMDKSLWAAVAMLAVLKAGGVVLPLGTQQPLARLDIVLQDTQARVILVDDIQVERLAGKDVRLIKVDKALIISLTPSIRASCTTVRPNNAAWVVYTSGSTGTPKGVVLQHSALCTSIKSHGPAFGVSPESRVLQFASHTFDVTIQEVFTTLCQGGCVCIPSENDRVNDLQGFIATSGVNFLSLTSTVAGLLAPSELPLVKTVILMGEPVKPAVLDLWKDQATVLESYAPSECSIYATVSPQPMKDISQVPVLGIPLASCFWVVDPKDYNLLCPIGAPGELLIEGPLLARGYLNDAVKTAKSFIVDPSFVRRYSLGNDRRMYRTGDLVRRNDDGSYTTLGRQGTQIKIRGQRVEVGEIEYHITRHSSRTQAVVVFAQSDALRGQLVAAFSVPNQGEASFSRLEIKDDQKVDKQAAMLIASEIQLYLSQFIPDYMIPRIWIPIATLPMNNSGKADRLSLSRWINELSVEDIATLSEYTHQAEDDLPVTAVERQLRDVWSTVLNRPQVSYRRSFLSLGGDSITAMQIVSACRRVGLTVSVRDVLQSAAISELALKVKKSTGEQYNFEIPDGLFDLSPAQRMFFCDIAPSGSRSDGPYRFNQSVVFRLQQPVQPTTIARAVETIVSKHAMLRARFEHSESHGWQQRIEKQLTGSFHFQVHQAQDDKEAQEITQSSQNSLSLEDGPVFAVDFIEAPDRQLLFLTAHHLVVDLMSWRIIAQDLERALQSGTLSESFSLPFPAWSSALMQRADTEEASVTAPSSSAWAYWGLVPGEYVAADQVFAEVALDKRDTALLLGPANEAFRSGPSDILLAALYTSFKEVFSDRTRPTVYAESHGRNDQAVDWDLSETVGWFTALMPMRLPECDESNSFLSTLRHVKDFRKFSAGRAAVDFAAKYTRGRNAIQNIEILFNYHGQFQQLENSDGFFGLDRLHQSVGEANNSIGEKVRQQAAINVEVFVTSEEAHINISFSRHCPKAEGIRQWLKAYSQAITNGLEQLTAVDLEATISDFPLAHLSDADLITLEQHCKANWTEIEDVLPCSPVQQGIILSQLKSPETYRLKQTCRILPMPGHHVDTSRLAAAWKRVISQHSIMRTIFTGVLSEKDKFYQVVLKAPHADIRIVRCRTEAEVQDCIKGHELLDDPTSHQPLHRFVVIETDDGNLLGHFEISHALVDASSVQILVETLLQAYEDAGQNDQGRSPAVYSSKYSSYVAFLEQHSENIHLQYWKDLLGGAESCYLQPGQNIKETKAAGGICAVTTVLNDASALREICQTYEITAATVFQLAWAIILSLYVDSDQVCFGYLSSGRDIPIDNVDTLVGPMINMMIGYIGLNRAVPVIDALRRIQTQFIEGFEHQRASLGDIQHALQASQSLFNTTMSYRRAPSLNSTQQAKFIQLESIAAEEPTEYEFNLTITDHELDVRLALQFMPEVTTPERAQRLLNQVKHVVQTLSQNAKTRLDKLNIVSADDMELIKKTNERAPAALESCVHLMVQEVTDRQPNAIAINAWDGQVTYYDLDVMASTLAQHLMTIGVRPQVMVGVCMDKSRWAAVAMLALLKAGGVCVPLGTQQPLARVQTILDDTEAHIILVDVTQERRFADADISLRLIRVDGPLLGSLASTSSFSCASVKPEDAAWVVYTSGSTGTPKGVVLQHVALCTSMKTHGAAFSLGIESRVLQFAAHTFDVTIQEVFTTLCYGGCVCVPSEDDRMNNLEHCITSLGVNFLSLTSTVAQLLDPFKLPLVKTLILIGEPVKPAVLDLWMDHAAILDAYGPSECSIQSAISPEPMTDRRQATVLGTPLESCCFWIVDFKDYNVLLPVGVAGELLIEGPHLAREYLNDEAKTQRSFIVDPTFITQNGSESGFGSGRRMYRTGDLVRQNEDGTYTNLGRRDMQIKIRGQRVEVGEIEYHISQHPSDIQAIVVFSRQGELDKGQLVTAFSGSAILKDDQTIDKQTAMLVASEIQLHLSQHVPQYMIPRVWVPMEMLPVNTSGKIDRLAITKFINKLSPEEMAAFSEDVEHAEDLPATNIERQLRDTWSTVLNQPITQVGYRRSFLSLGGDSITAMQVVSACRGLGLAISVRDILQSPAISELALKVKKTNLMDEQRLVEIPEGPFELSPAQQMFFDEIAPQGLRSDGAYRFNQSVCFRFQQPMQQATVARAIEAIVAKHAMLRARFQRNEDVSGSWRQHVEKRLTGSYRFQTHYVKDYKTAQEIIRLSQSSLDLEHGPVFAANFFEMPDRQLLFMAAHHLVIDLMSWRIIAHDLEQLLQRGAMLSSQSLAFSTWCLALMQKAYAANMTIPVPNEPVQSWAYWGLQPGQYLAGEQIFATAEVDKETTALLLGPANHALRSMSVDILLAALYVSFRQAFSDRKEPSIFVENHGRNDESADWDLSDTVGWFTTVMPLILSEDGELTFLSVLRQVKDLRNLHAGREPLEFAVQRARGNMTGQGLIEVLFNYHGQFQQIERPDGLLTLDRLHQPVGHSDAAVGDKVKQHAVLNLEVSVDAGKAHISLGFGRHSPKSEVILDWLKEYSETIAKGVNELMTTESGATVTDFPLACLINADLTTLYHQCLIPADLHWEDVEDVLPCSAVQQGILLSQLKAPSTYRLKQTCRILSRQESRPVDIGRLADAWREVLSRHSIMRTTFTGALSHRDRFFQIVLRSPEPDIRTIHCARDADVHLCTESHSLVEDQAGRPPHRFVIITTDEGGVYGHFEISHALVDASSVQLLVDTLMQAYEGASTYGSNYSTYVSFLEQRSENEDIHYWKTLLGTAEPCHLQLSQNSSAALVEETHEVSTIISDVSALRNLSRTYGITPANVFQLSWALVLSSYTESDLICFGYLSSGRDIPIDGVDTLVGPMINMMICYIQLDHSKKSIDVMRNIQDQFLEGFEHQRASLASIQHALQSPHQTLFNTTVSYRRAPNMDDTSGHASSIQFQRTTADESTEYDFNLSLMEGDHEIELVLQYRPGIAIGRTANRLLTQLKHVVQTLSHNMNDPLEQLDLVPAEDKVAIRAKNETIPTPVASCIHTLVQQVTDNQPDAAALHAWDGLMTFDELDVAASTLASHLVASGAGPEIMVGICVDKSRWAAVAMLAVLKSGSVVLPLGTQQPLGRVQTVLKDTQARIVLVDAKQEERLAEILDLHLIKVDDHLLDGLTPTKRFASTTVTTDNAAWVVYTSGSTGVPKGVVLQHSALCSSIKSHGPAFGVHSKSRVLQFASHTFDVTIQEVFTTLCQGGCVCIPSEDDRLNRLQDFISINEVNFLSLTSTVTELLDPEKLPLIEIVILMGEPVKPAVLDLWKDRIVLESYAPSECSIYATVSPQPMKHISQVPVLGVPLSSCFWVVDVKNYNRLCPIGTPGELLIEGPLLARGYLNDPTKTNTSFLINPDFIAQIGLDGAGPRRMYRTGDLVRQNDDGSYTTLGRRDTQVKIRGQRVEVGEIEYWTVRSLPEVHSAAAMLVSREGGQSAVLAVAVEYQNEGTGNDSQEQPFEKGLLSPSMELLGDFEQVRGHLMEVLPRYMVPDIFIPLSRLPLNNSGKLDRRAIDGFLKRMSEEQLENYRPEAAIKAEVVTEAEVRLQKLWSEVLGRPANTIGAKDNFFHLGGDSITAMRLVEASRNAHMSLRVADVFEHPRLSELAGILGSRTEEGENKPPVEDIAALSMWHEYSVDGRDGYTRVLMAEVAERCAVTPEQIEDVYPCTPLQEGLLLTTTQQPSAYISRRVFKLGEEIDIKRLKAAWQKMADAAPILRTRILLGRSSGSVQVVVNAPLEWYTGTSLDDYLERDRATSMSEGRPLVRFGLIESAAGERLFVWTAHHSAYDGWSLLSMYRQVAEIYWEEEEPHSAPYTPFIAYLGCIDAGKSAAYWREQLQGDLTADFPALPHVRYQPRPTKRLVKSWNFARQAKSEVSLSNLLRAAWSLLVAKYTGGSDVVFAVALSGRNAPIARVTEILAPTITTVPVRVHIDPSTSVYDFLRTIQHQATGMMPFEHTGLQRIRELAPELAAALDMKHLFVVQPAAESDDVVDFPGLTLREDLTSEFDSYSLTVECTLGRGSGISVEMRFDEAVVPVSDVERMLDYLGHLTLQLDLAESAHEVDVRIADMEPLAASDLALVHANNDHVLNTTSACAHQLVLEVAARQPSATAICAWDGSLSYAELSRLSSQLAHHLAGLGVRPEVAVGLCMEKSRWAAVSMLAILMAGGTVVPLGVQLPLGRLTHIVRDASVGVVLADEHHTARLASLGPHLVTIGAALMTDLPLGVQTFRAALEPKPKNAAWIVYTSGSTGVPKGVVLEHTGICTSVQSQVTAFGLSQHSRALQFAAHTFDAAIQEIFATLAAGGCVCIPSEEERMNDLEAYIHANDINFLSLTSTVTEMLNPLRLPKVETIVLLGEPVKPAILDLWMSHVSVLNGYGPTECTIYSAVSPEKMSDRKQATVLGVSLNSCRFWVVDPKDYNRLCPIGTPGELLIEGPHVARGYLNDVEKTQNAFLTDPGFVTRYGLGVGRRMYRTGDLVKQSSDDTYTNLGRQDTQIKIRGQRVEVGEIEYWAVRSLPEVRSAIVVLLRRDDKQPARLVMALELVGQDITNEAIQGSTRSLLNPTESLLEKFGRIQNCLRENLPRYMVPELLIPMAQFPLNASGKLDRRAIKEMLQNMTDIELETYRSGAGAKTEDVSTDEERQLQKLWSDVLRRPASTIGASDNFFQLGGDSILAIQLVAAARAERLKMSVSQVFQYPVLRDLCKRLDQVGVLQNAGDGGHGRKALDPATDDAIRKMIPSHQVEAVSLATDFQALVIDEHLKGRWIMYITMSYDGRVDEETIRQAFQRSVSSTEILRTTFVRHAGHTYQVVLDGFVGVFEKRKSSGNLSQFCKTLIEEDQSTRLRESEAPLKSWFVEGEHRNNLIIRMSHAQYDGLSLPMFIQLLQNNGIETDVQPRQMSYFLDALKSIDTKPAVAFWREMLNGSTMTTLPAPLFPTEQHELTSSFQEFTMPSPKRSSQPFTVYLKAAWAVALARTTGTTDVVFGNLISGRSMQLDDIEKVRGPCINLTPVRINTALSEDAALKQISEQQIAAMPHEHLGFETLFRECTSWPIREAQPARFGSILQYQNVPEYQGAVTLHGAECKITYDMIPPDMTDVWLSVYPMGDTMRFSAGYTEQLVDSSVVRRLLVDLKQVLESMQEKGVF